MPRKRRYPFIHQSDDERRWVREGVLPRCGWMAEEIPESPRWTERAPEREAERAKLEAKRGEALRKLEGR